MGPATSTEQAEIHREQQFVDRVYSRLAAMVENAGAIREEGRTRGLLDYTGQIKEEDYRSLFERDVMVDHAVRRLAVLDAQREGLVFGRLDQRGGEVRYIGRIGVRDAEHEPLVIDWRAPVASVFYQATAVDPKGVVRRRVLRCQGQRVVGVEDDLLDPDHAASDLTVVGDGALMAALTAARGRQMRDIVATIQREQDEIIRAPSPGVTLISGGPGTGKTVVALHRAAYLLYTDRRRIAGGGVLVVGPSPVFMSYIERVLPSLGEQEATLRSIGEIVDGVVARRHDPFEAAVVKGSLRMRQVLARAARSDAPGAPDQVRLYAAGRMLRLGPAELAAVRNDVLRRGSRRNRARADAVRALLAALWRKAADGSPVSRAEFEEELSDRDAFVEFVDAWWPILRPEQVLGWLSDRDRLARTTKGVLRPAEVDTLVASWAATEGFSVEDVPLLDELHALLGDPPVPPPPSAEPFEYDGVREVTTWADRDHAQRGRVDRGPQLDGYAHVLVDEAQDLSPMQWRMLGRRGRHASWTIVGDPAQSAWPDIAEAAAARDAALTRGTRRTFHLSTNYRNSAEIFDLAAGVIRRELPDLPLPEAVRQTGHPPTHLVIEATRRADAVRATVETLLDEVEGTVGVIVPQAREAEVSGWLADLAAVHGDRVAVATGLASKGLEYDAVAVVEPSEIASESPVGLRTLYVVLTRATQRLVTVGVDDWLGIAG
ncbi:HelD family protein [Actinopolymorpha alba]|uniref:HelD family protein n=1 Tax=Actinopolymorpha alba TaxID=533267 RepID=UPI000380AE24|nr:UvrD-helicase domain-containing protein [Actinopolymorpha alba]